MNFIKYFLSIMLTALTLAAIAQPGGGRGQRGGKPSPMIIKGVVLDKSSNSPLEFATVALFSMRDSSLLTGGITEADGSFKVEVKGRAFYMEVEFIGYEKLTVPDIKATKGGGNIINLGNIALSSGGISLDEVQVTAERSELQFGLDKRVFNVGKDLSSTGGNAQDILDNIPSVTVGVEGEVELRGSGNVRVLINGRPSGLIGLDGTDGLRNIQANMIERVEVITNPSAKFEAEGMAGIINIILKKERAKGFNGSFEVSGGLPTTYGIGANINYRQDKFNFFINGNYQKRTGPATGNTYQEFYQGDTTYVSLLEQERQRSGRNTSIQAGSDYYFSDNEVLTMAFLYRYGIDNNDNFVSYRDSTFFSPSGTFPRLVANDFDRYTLRTDDELEEEPTLEFSLNYDKKFDRKGHELKATVSYQDNTETESSDLNESIYLNDALVEENVFSQTTANKEGQNNLRTQLDYVLPMDGGIKVEMGALGNFRIIENDFEVNEIVDGIAVPDPNLTNNFIYQEDVAALYANYGQELDKWSYQAGLRGEWSFISTELVNTNELNDRNYLNLFPSLFLGYKFDATNTLQASYSKRIRRPRFWDLNPFFTLTDRRNFFSGNPNLNPEFTDSYEISHLKYWEKGNIGTSVYYRRTTDLITRIVGAVPGSINETVTRPENIGIENSYGVEVVWGYNAAKWIKVDGSVNGFGFDVNGDSDSGESLNVNALAWEAKLNARINFWNNANLQVRVNYRAPRETVQGSRKSITAVNMAASKDFLNNNLTVTLSVRDLLNDRRRRYINETELLFREGDFQWRPRTLTVTLNYRINSKKKRGGRPSGYDGGGGDF